MRLLGEGFDEIQVRDENEYYEEFSRVTTSNKNYGPNSKEGDRRSCIYSREQSTDYLEGEI
ncbi:MAG: hypothetical protein QXJ64_10005 [Thermosphaera sp.]